MLNSGSRSQNVTEAAQVCPQAKQKMPLRLLVCGKFVRNGLFCTIVLHV